MTWFNWPLIMAGRVWAALMAAATVKVWAQVGGAMANTLVLVGFGLVIWLGPWEIIHQALQLNWLGYGMVIAGFLSLVNIVAITGLSVSVRGGKDGLSANIDQDEARPLAPIVETVTKTTVTPQAPAAEPHPEPAAATGELAPEDRIQR